MAANDGDIQRFLDKALNIENQIAWKQLILNDEMARQYLSSALRELREMKERGQGYVPDDNQILKSLTFKPPSDIKAIIVGHDPINSRELASGVAFSFPRSCETSKLQDYLVRLGQRAQTFTQIELKEYMDSTDHSRLSGFAMVVMKIALLRAEAEEVGDLNFCYEDRWAKQGVLLLNSALTVNEGDRRPKVKHEFWFDFTARLIFLVLRESRHKPVLGMFWGDFAREVLRKVKEHNVQNTVDLAECRKYHHPTWPRNNNNYMENAETDFRRLQTVLSGDDGLPEEFGRLHLNN